MSVFVYTRPENSKSAVKLGWPVTTDFRQIPRGSTVIRWGNGNGSDPRDWPRVLNKASVMELSTNKLAALQKMKEAGVSVPEVYTSGQSLPRGHRYVARPASHAEGSDFQLVDGGQRCPTDHATRFIEDAREYRVWFIHDKYLCAKRVPGEEEGQEADNPCRSKWLYGPYIQPFPGLKEQMAKVRLAIPLDFGAVDALWSESERKWFILEVNSAPSLDAPGVLRHFQTHLTNIVASVPSATGRSETHLQAIVGAPEPEEIVRAEPEPVRAANRQPERPTPIRQAPATLTWEERYEAKLRAEKAAKEKEIWNRVYGE